jgi:hypothetical protein
MFRVKMSDLVTRRLMGGNCDMTGRDEQGLFARYNAISIDLQTNTVSLLLGREVVASWTFDFATSVKDHCVTVVDLDGRLRINLKT